MTAILSGPMFEAAQNDLWKSIHDKPGAHYNIFGGKGTGLEPLKGLFPTGEADDLNLVLFSTSGIHGHYGTIEDAEADFLRGNKDEDGEDCAPSVTYLVIQPRICCLRYGNCEPRSEDDFKYLKKLRRTSWKVLATIGKHTR